MNVGGDMELSKFFLYFFFFFFFFFLKKKKKFLNIYNFYLFKILASIKFNKLKIFNINSQGSNAK